MYEKYDNNIQDIIAAQNGDEKAMEDLISNNKGLIWSIINRFKDRGYEVEDLPNSSNWIYKVYKKV